MKISVFIATSTNGLIARPDGDVDWLMEADQAYRQSLPQDATPEDYGFHEFFNSVDVMVMGRNSFEKVMSFGQWPYEGKRVIVLSRTQTQAPESHQSLVEFYNGEIEALVQDLKSQGYQRAYIDGGLTIQKFLEAQLITDMCITLVPVILASGIPLFGDSTQDVKLKVISSKLFDSGYISSVYEVNYPA